MLFVGGWYNSHLPGTIAALSILPPRRRSGHDLRSVLGRIFRGLAGSAAMISDQMRLATSINCKSAGSTIGSKARTPGLCQNLRSDCSIWGRMRGGDSASWPANRATHFFLHGSGRASIDDSDGKLGFEPPSREATDFVVHDPWRPVPAVGGALWHAVRPGRSFRVDARPDVLTFTTEPAVEPITIAGDVAAELWLCADAPSFDVSCVLSRVAPQGEALPLAQGYRLVKPGTNLNQPIEIPLRATCATIKPGERLRLSVAGACFPAYPVNPGTGQNPRRRRLPRRVSSHSACGTAETAVRDCGSASVTQQKWTSERLR